MGKKLKILHLIEDLGSGGAERLLFTNLKYLDRDALESEVVTVFSSGDHWKEAIEDLGTSVSTLGCRSMREVVRGTARLMRLIKRSKPDIIHTHLWTANVIGRIAGRIAGIPVISSIHNPDYEPESFNDGSKMNYQKKFSVKALDNITAKIGCERMIAVSNYTRESTRKRLHFPPERIDLIYNPIDIEAFENGPETDKPQFLNDHGLPRDATVLLNVARVTPQKGLIYAIRAMAEISNEFPNVHLLSIGGQDDKIWLGQIEREITKLELGGRVHLLGPKGNVHEYLVNSNIFVFPSVHEGLGIALIEAMAVGLACIASEMGPIPEYVSHDENGMLVTPKDPAGLAHALSELLMDPEKRTRLGKAARETALSLFQPLNAAKQLTEVYFSVARTHSVANGK